MHATPPISPTTMRCVGCGYDLSGAAIGGACPECGLGVAETIRSMTQGPKTCGLATASMVVGILSVAMCMLCGPIAMYLAHSAKQQMREGGYSDGSRTMAKAGMILGVIGTAIIILYAMIFGIGVSL